MNETYFDYGIFLKFGQLLKNSIWHINYENNKNNNLVTSKIVILFYLLIIKNTASLRHDGGAKQVMTKQVSKVQNNKFL